MFKFLIAPVAAASLALAVTAPPARAADAREIATIVAGLAAVGLIAKAVKDNKDKAAARRDRYAPAQAEPYDYRLETTRNSRHDGDRHDNGRGPRYGDGWRKSVLPGECVRSVETRRGYRQVVSERCLESQGVRTSRLPNRCDIDADYRGRSYAGYDVSCLRAQGYRFEIGDNRYSRREDRH